MIDAISLIVALLGASLYIMATYYLLRKSQKPYDEWVISAAAIAFLFYFLGNLLALFARALVSDIATYTYRLGWIISIIGLTGIPSLLVHSYGTYYYKIKFKTGPSPPGQSNRPYHILTGLHLFGVYFMILFLAKTWAATPLTWSTLISDINPIHLKLFTFWLGFGLVAAGIYSLKMVYTLKWERFRDYLSINGIFLLLAALAGVVLLLSLHLTPGTGPTLRLIFLAIALVHGALLASYRVRYQFMDVFIRPSIIYALLAGLIVLIYHLGIRNLSQYLSRFPTINVELVELVLLMVLIFLFQPARVRIQARVNALFFQRTKKHRDTVHDISKQLKSSGNLDSLLTRISTQLQKTLELRHLEIIRSSTPAAEQFTATFDLLRHSPEPILFNYASYGDVATEIREAGMEIVLAIRRENEVLGIVGVGPKQLNEEISANEIRLLRTIANQLAVSIKNTLLVEEQLRHERLMMNQEKLSSLGQIAANITHDVKNPLSAVNTLVQVMQEELPQGESLKTDLKTIEKELAHLNRILSEIVKYSRPESMAVQPVAVDEVLSDILTLLNKEAELNGVTLKLDGRSHAHVAASLDTLKEIFFNLVLNAIQACSDDGGTVRLATSVKNGRVEIRVTDNGPGIPEDKLQEVFEPFFTTKPSGTGLGLAIVKDKIVQVDGSISVHNAPRGGVQFTVKLPPIQGDL